MNSLILYDHDLATERERLKTLSPFESEPAFQCLAETATASGRVFNRSYETRLAKQIEAVKKLLEEKVPFLEAIQRCFGSSALGKIISPSQLKLSGFADRESLLEDFVAKRKRATISSKGEKRLHTTGLRGNTVKAKARKFLEECALEEESSERATLRTSSSVHSDSSAVKPAELPVTRSLSERLQKSRSALLLYLSGGLSSRKLSAETTSRLEIGPLITNRILALAKIIVGLCGALLFGVRAIVSIVKPGERIPSLIGIASCIGIALSGLRMVFYCGKSNATIKNVTCIVNLIKAGLGSDGNCNNSVLRESSACAQIFKGIFFIDLKQQK